MFKKDKETDTESNLAGQGSYSVFLWRHDILSSTIVTDK